MPLRHKFFKGMFQQYFYHKKQRHVPKQKFRFKRVETQAFKKAVKKSPLEINFILLFTKRKKIFVPVYVKYKRNLVVFAKSQSQGGFFVEANAHQNLIVIIYNFEANQ